MYGPAVPPLLANKLAHEARANGWTSLNWIAQNGDMWRLFGVPPNKSEPKSDPRPAWLAGPPRIRSELGGLMGPGYQATGYEPPPRRQVLLDDPTGDDIAGDVP